MKSLAELKRTLQVGTRLRVVDHWKPDLIGTVRMIVKLQTARYAFLAGADTQRAWSDLAPAKAFTFPAPGQYRYQENDKYWTLEIIPQSEAEAEVLNMVRHATY